MCNISRVQRCVAVVEDVAVLKMLHAQHIDHTCGLQHLLQHDIDNIACAEQLVVGSAAANSPLEVGEVIQSVNGTDCSYCSTDHLADLLLGPEGLSFC